MDKVITHSKKLQPEMIDFFGTITENDALLPDDYFTKFELGRLQYTYYGCLKNMDSNKSKVLIAGIFFFRAFVKGIIMDYPEALGLPKKTIGAEKLLNIGSVLYNMGIEYVKMLTAANKDAQSQLSQDIKIKDSKPVQALSYGEEKIKVDPKKDNTRESDIINGFYAKGQMDCVFKDRKKT